MVDPVDTLDELRDLYPLIQEGYAAIASLCESDMVGIDADIYRLVANGSCKAVVITDEDKVWGWATFTVNKTLQGNVEGRIIDMYIRPGAPAYLFDESVDYIEKDMMANGASVISFNTKRKALVRRTKRLGYELASYSVIKRV